MSVIQAHTKHSTNNTTTNDFNSVSSFLCLLPPPSLHVTFLLCTNLRERVCGVREIQSHILFEVLRIHVCGSCKAQCAHPCQRDIQHYRNDCYYHYMLAPTHLHWHQVVQAVTHQQAPVSYTPDSIQTHSPKPLPRSQSHYSRIKMTALPKLWEILHTARIHTALPKLWEILHTAHVHTALPKIWEITKGADIHILSQKSKSLLPPLFSNISHPNINMWYITPSWISIFPSWGHAVLKCWESAMVSWKNIVPEVMTCSNVSWSSHETQTTALISMITSVCMYWVRSTVCHRYRIMAGWRSWSACVRPRACMHACVSVCAGVRTTPSPKQPFSFPASYK